MAGRAVGEQKKQVRGGRVGAWLEIGGRRDIVLRLPPSAVRREALSPRVRRRSGAAARQEAGRGFGVRGLEVWVGRGAAHLPRCT